MLRQYTKATASSRAIEAQFVEYTMRNMSVEDILHVSKDEAYELQAKEEAAHFDRPRRSGMDVKSPETDSYRNLALTGDPDVAWFETIPSYGKFLRGCALGAGGLEQRTSLLEQNPELHLTIYDISSESLAILERGMGERFPGRVATELMDLNFAEMPAAAFDLIVSSGCIHHLYNLEHIAFQIEYSLTQDDYFFLEDYVGEARFQFSRAKKEMFEEAFLSIQGREPLLRHWRIAWPDDTNWTFSPFEALRADETLEVFRRYLSEVELHTVGALLFLGVFVVPPEPLGRPQSVGAHVKRRLSSFKRQLVGPRGSDRDAKAKLASELVPLDREVTESGSLRPSSAFAVYRKRSHVV